MVALTLDATAPALPAPLIRELKGLPLLGAAHLIRRDPLHFLSDLVNRADKVLFIPHMAQRIYLVNTPAGVEHVLEKNHKNYRKSNFYHKLKPVFGEGLPVLEREDWKRHRQLMQPSFRKKEIQRIGHLAVEKSHELVERWKTQEGQVVNLDAEMARLTLDVVATALFGSDIQRYADAVAGAIDDILSIAELRLWAVPDLYLTWLSPYYWRFKKARKTLDDTIHDFVSRRKGRENENGDLLDMLMLAAEAHTGTQITYGELRDEITTLLITGHESTSNALTWMFYYLAQYPDIRERMVAELEVQLEGRDPTHEDMARLPYTKAVLQEVIRLYPASWSIGRANYEDDEIEGVHIPANSNVMVSPYLMHRNRRFFHKPEAFRPERFLNGEVDGLDKYAYFPFGGGPRGCIGEGFAWHELISIAAVLVRAVDLDLAPGQRVEPLARISIKPAHGMRMIPARRAA